MKLQKKILTAAISSTLLLSSFHINAASEVDELRAQMQILLDRIDQLEQKSKETSQKVADNSKRASVFNNENITVEVSGHINRGVLVTDSGDNSSTDNVDNDASSSRIRFIGELAATPEVTIGTAIEFELDSNTSSRIGQSNRDGDDERSTSFQNRRTELYIDSSTYGKLWLGLGSTASDGSAEQDLSGTALAGYSAVSDIGGGFSFENEDGSFSGTTVGNANSNFDGLSRQNRIRYDTPSYSGLQLRTSLGENSAFDTALFYNKELSFAKISAAAAYSDLGSESGDESSSSNDDQISGSASILLNNGLNATVAYGKQNNDSSSDDPESYYVKLGYRTNLFAFGESAFSVDYSNADDIGTAGNDAESYGLQYVQKVDAWSTEFYAGYRRFELSNDATDTNFEDIDQAIFGARVKF